MQQVLHKKRGRLSKQCNKELDLKREVRERDERERDRCIERSKKRKM